MNTKYFRGSEWRKWDLHIHSIASDGKGTPQQIIDEAKSKGLDVIALTDHHTAKNIDEVKRLGTANGISVISGIEFRTEYGSSSVHMIGLFPDNYNGNSINTKFLNEIILSPLGLSETTVIMSAKNKKGYKYTSDDKAFKDGIFFVQVDFKKAANLIHDYGGLVIVHAGNKGDGIEEIKHQGKADKNVKTLYESLGTLKEELLNDYIDICEIQGENDSEAFYFDKFKKPSITASDAHEIKDIGYKYTWIKADPTFDGLKQVLFEPKPNERISLNIGKPKGKPDYSVINSIVLDKESIWKQEIPLNDNLVTIIGGRSTGKSTLLSSIAKSINKDIEVEEHIVALTSSVTITWKDDGKNENREIEFFPQNHMISIAQDPKEINRLIGNIIKTKAEYSLIEDYHIVMDETRKEIAVETENYYKLFNELKKEQNNLRELNDKESVNKELDKIKKNITVIRQNNDISMEELSELDSLKKKLTILISEKTKLEKDIEVFSRVKSENIFNSSFNLELINLSEEVTKKLETLISIAKEEFIIKINTEFEKTKNEIVNELTVNYSNMKEIEEKPVYKKGLTLAQNNKELEELENKLKIEEKKLNIISEKEKVVGVLRVKSNEIFEEILKLNYSYISNLEKIVNSFNLEFTDIKIVAKSKYLKEELEDFLSSALNLKSLINKGFKDNLLRMYENKFEINDLKNIIVKILNNTLEFKGKYNDTKPIFQLEFLQKNWLELYYDLIYQEDSFVHMSQGKKSFVILKLLLDFSDKKCPILIDQPEDNLDNRAIYKDMVLYLKEKKKERQIIIVTHNPNIVVGADAEQVIVANHHGIDSKNTKDIRFEYLSGSLENSKIKDSKELKVLYSQGIREHVCELLEGGSDAFKKREKQYSL